MNRFFKIFLLIITVLSVSLSGVFAEERDSDQEYLAFEFFLSGTFQKQYEMLEGQREPKTFFDTSRALLDYKFNNFSLFVDWSMIDDERYDPSEVYLGGRYFYINDAYVDYKTDYFYLKAGRSTQKDVIDSPYSLFVNSEPLPAIQVEAEYTGDLFFYTDRWVSLNNNSRQTYFGYGPDDTPFADDPYADAEAEYELLYPNGVEWVDRGAHYHVYGLDFGSFRFGFQESAVTYGSSFSPEFFFSPMIMYFAQLVMDDGAKPWQEYANSKHFIGFFFDQTKDDSYFASQFLVDDINGDLWPSADNDNQNRIAWSIGGYRDFDFGRIGFYHAGATKDTFGATYSNTTDKTYEDFNEDDVPIYYSYHPYPYTYYPAVEYTLEDGTTRMPIDYTQNYIGYKYGENNISFMVDYENTFFKDSSKELSLYASLEWILNGDKSPANPWHEYDRWTEIVDPTQLFDDTIEHVISLRTRMSRPVTIFGVDFSVFADLELGVAINAMALEPTAEDTEFTEPWTYRPQEGVYEPLSKLTLGMGYLWRIK